MPEDNDALKPQPTWRSSVLGLIIWLVARTIGITLRLRRPVYHRLEKDIAEHQGAILVIWHGRTLVAANELVNRGYWALISLSRDGEIQNNIFQRFGFQTIRGSTGRGGVRAALKLARIAREGGVVAFTPDGPRGPTHKVQLGTIMLAQKSGRPIIPLSSSAWPRKLLHSWDSYLIPAPFARAAFVTGKPVFVPPGASDVEIEAIVQQLEHDLDACEMMAEELAGVPERFRQASASGSTE